MKYFKYAFLVALMGLLSACNDEQFNMPVPQPGELEDTVIVDPPSLTHMIIEEIRILDFPELNPDGNPWDFFIDERPDFNAIIQSFDRGYSSTTDTLRPFREDGYETTKISGNCYLSSEDAVLLEGADYLAVPVNFKGTLSLMDFEPKICLPFACRIPGNTEMKVFTLVTADFVNERPREIFMTDYGDCRYVLHLIVRWI